MMWRDPSLAPVVAPSDRADPEVARHPASTVEAPSSTSAPPRWAPPELGPADVHVWTVRLNIARSDDERSHASLSDDERARARRSPFADVRRRFAVCRASLRAILAGYLDGDPLAIAFRYGPFGKPRLDPARHPMSLRFNVSHADDLALVAVARDRELGVDVERLREVDGLDEIAARCFGLAERDTVRRADPASRLSAFFRAWTLKEAYLKACGTGMSGALDRIDAAAGNGLLRLLDVESGAQRWWSARALDVGPGYVAALAVERQARPISTVTLRPWPAHRSEPVAGAGDE